MIQEILDAILQRNGKEYNDLTAEEKIQYQKYYTYFTKGFTVEDIKRGLKTHKEDLMKELSDYKIVGDRAIFLKACYNIDEYILSLITKDEAQRKVVEEELKKSAQAGT